MFTRSKLLFDGKFAQRKLCQSYPVYMLKFVQSFLHSTTHIWISCSSFFKLTRNCLHRSWSERCFDWSIPIKVLQSFWKIGLVSISSKSIKVLWQSFWCRFTRTKNFVKENFDQVFDGNLWSCKQAFISCDFTADYTRVEIQSLLIQTHNICKLIESSVIFHTQWL